MRESAKGPPDFRVPEAQGKCLSKSWPLQKVVFLRPHAGPLRQLGQKGEGKPPGQLKKGGNYQSAPIACWLRFVGRKHQPELHKQAVAPECLRFMSRDHFSIAWEVGFRRPTGGWGGVGLGAWGVGRFGALGLWGFGGLGVALFFAPAIVGLRLGGWQSDKVVMGHTKRPLSKTACGVHLEQGCGLASVMPGSVPKRSVIAAVFQSITQIVWLHLPRLSMRPEVRTPTQPP